MTNRNHTQQKRVLAALHSERFVDHAPEQVVSTLMDEGVISGVSETSFNIVITYTSGAEPTTVNCQGNLNSTSCVFMGTCSVPGGSEGETEPVTFLLNGNQLTGNMLVKGMAGCQTRYAITAMRR
jgi:hypothetical protein